jgi:hypothetical protein
MHSPILGSGILDLGEERSDLVVIGGRLKRYGDLFASKVGLDGFNARKLTQFHLDSSCAMYAVNCRDTVGYSGHFFSIDVSMML